MGRPSGLLQAICHGDGTEKSPILSETSSLRLRLGGSSKLDTFPVKAEAATIDVTAGLDC